MNEEYEQGLRDGRISSLEETIKNHADKFDSHERRLQVAERILYGLIGAFALVQFLPELKRLLG